MRGIVLYGSEALGEAGADSDIDLLVLLDGPVQWTSDVRAIIDVLHPPVLERERPIHAVPVEDETCKAGKFAVHREAQHEGVLV